MEGDRVAVRGVFGDVLANGCEVAVEFADFFEPDEDRQFARRENDFFAPLI
ncbi:hypothetical protein ABT168_04380 [Streptomyces sp. NPDC001793]|uniref:hypothetical protein n=1 Tax=Streptomyces sp. NPDC001793 TaxID=3154657 RepID=UPI0033338E8E